MRYVLPVAFMLIMSLNVGHASEQSNKCHFSWQNIHKDALELAEKVKDKGPFEGVIGVARGGLVPATIIANALGIKKVIAFSISSYDSNGQQRELVVLDSVTDKEKKWLVIDDLVDSGATLEKVSQYLPESYFAVLYAKPQGKSKTDVFVKEVSQDTWVVFPWEETLEAPIVTAEAVQE
ncbi:MAG: xanthine phosphoribosyltransferase [bacterium]|nr:xanthine phosphoribosyltransferase [bacterium]